MCSMLIPCVYVSFCVGVNQMNCKDCRRQSYAKEGEQVCSLLIFESEGL